MVPPDILANLPDVTSDVSDDHTRAPPPPPLPPQLPPHPPTHNNAILSSSTSEVINLPPSSPTIPQSRGVPYPPPVLVSEYEEPALIYANPAASDNNGTVTDLCFDLVEKPKLAQRTARAGVANSSTSSASGKKDESALFSPSSTGQSTTFAYPSRSQRERNVERIEPPRSDLSCAQQQTPVQSYVRQNNIAVADLNSSSNTGAVVTSFQGLKVVDNRLYAAPVAVVRLFEANCI